MRVEAAWRLGKWEDLEEILDHVSDYCGCGGCVVGAVGVSWVQWVCCGCGGCVLYICEHTSVLLTTLYKGVFDPQENSSGSWSIGLGRVLLAAKQKVRYKTGLFVQMIAYFVYQHRTASCLPNSCARFGVSR